MKRTLQLSASALLLLVTIAGCNDNPVADVEPLSSGPGQATAGALRAEKPSGGAGFPAAVRTSVSSTFDCDPSVQSCEPVDTCDPNYQSCPDEPPTDTCDPNYQSCPDDPPFCYEDYQHSEDGQLALICVYCNDQLMYCDVATPQYDSDGDGVADGEDRCEGSPDDQDSDGDGIPDGCDSSDDSTDESW